MKPICIIKSHPKGLSLIMDSQCSFEELVTEICYLFAKSRDFFKAKEMVLVLEGRELTTEETLVVIEAIELNSEVKVPYILDESQIRDVRTIGQLDRFYFEKKYDNAKIIKGNVNASDVITSDTGVLVIGDVKKGASVIAMGNVIVSGSLIGDVRAGEDGDETAFIVADTLVNHNVTIAGKTGEVKVTYRGIFSGRKKTEPVVIRLIEGKFHAEPLSDGLVKY